MSDTETYSGCGVECPHCHHVHRDYFDFKHDDDTHETECEACEKPFKYWTHTTTTYYADVVEANHG